MNTASNAPRKPRTALFLAVLLPGLGQLYNGQLNRGLSLFLAFALLSVPAPAAIALWVPAALMLPLLLLGLLATLGLYLFGMLDAWRQARRAVDYAPREWQQPAVYLALVLFAYIGVLGAATGYVRDHLVESFRIPSASMAPNVQPGDLLFADKRVNCPGCKHRVRHGDIAIFVYPNDRTLYYIKRIVGLPGDRLRVEGRQVWRNGEPLTLAVEGERVRERGAAGGYEVIWPASAGQSLEVEVPQGQVFVLGDRRDATRDSRHFGTVPLADVVGLARQVWFSYGEGGVRWERLGLTFMD